MPNPVLERLQDQRQQQVEFTDHLLAQVDEQGRDLSETERASLDTARNRIGEIDEQLTPLAEFEQLREASISLPTPSSRPRRGDGDDERRPLSAQQSQTPQYASTGHFMVDLTASLSGIHGHTPDPEAAARIQAAREAQTAAVAKQTTGETPGLLPVEQVGQVLNLIDGRRPLISSLGAQNMAGIAGTIFNRPKVSQHTKAGPQGTAGKSPDDEKTELPSQPLKVIPVPFTKATYGGTVNVSRQDIDWTDPGAWQIITNDLAVQYGLATEAVVATKFAEGIKQTQELPDPVDGDLKPIATALYEAAAKVYAGVEQLPNMIWVSVDMWAKIGAVVDQARLIFPPGADGRTAGNSSLASFEGNMFQLPRIVVPKLPAGTAILGVSSLYEVYEERIGLLQAIEPSILGVDVAYGGYLAHGFMEAKGFCKLAPKA